MAGSRLAGKRLLPAPPGRKIRSSPRARVDSHDVIETETDQQLQLRLAEPGDAETMQQVITQAFGARDALDPPADAMSDELADIEERIATQIGLIASDDSGVVGCLFCSLHPDADVPSGMLHRVSVLPGRRRNGVAFHMIVAAAQLATDAGMRRRTIATTAPAPASSTSAGPSHSSQVLASMRGLYSTNSP